MKTSNVVDFQAALERKAARTLELDQERLATPSELENAALRFFEVITETLEQGAKTEDVDRLVNRLDRVLEAIH